MLAENLAEKAFPLKPSSCGGMAQSVRRSSDSPARVQSHESLLKPHLPGGNGKRKVCNCGQKCLL